jgi:glycogen phosphorylase
MEIDQDEEAMWELTHNPWVVLQTVSVDQIQQTLADAAFRKEVDALGQSRQHAAASPAWFQESHAREPLFCVAYFGMETAQILWQR